MLLLGFLGYINQADGYKLTVGKWIESYLTGRHVEVIKPFEGTHFGGYREHFVADIHPPAF